jgi:hypothetical protein
MPYAAARGMPASGTAERRPRASSRRRRASTAPIRVARLTVELLRPGVAAAHSRGTAVVNFKVRLMKLVS